MPTLPFPHVDWLYQNTPWRGVTQSPTDGRPSWWTRLAIVPREVGGMPMHEVVHIQFPDKCLSDPDAKHVQTSIAFMSEDMSTELVESRQP